MSDCIFCQIVQGKGKSWKVYEDNHSYAFLDIFPVSEYHTLVIPKRHYQDIFDIPEQELHNLMTAVKKIVMLYNTRLGIRNLQIINSSGREAQQHVFHIHIHIVPRKSGDGQDVRWKTHPELVERFDQLLAKLA